MTDALSNIHEAMQSAILESQQESQMTTGSVKLPAHIKDQAQAICERHGVTLSAFFRQCATHLVRDYGGISGN